MAKSDVWFRKNKSGGGTWYANVWCPDRKTKIKSPAGPDRKDALALAAKMRAQFLAPGRARVGGAVPRLSEFIPIVLAQHYAGMSSYVKAERTLGYLLSYAGDVRLNEITRGVVRGFMDSRLTENVPHPFKTGITEPEKIRIWEKEKARRVGKTTVNHDLDFVKKMMNFAVEREVLEHNPIASVRKYNDKDTRSRKRTRYLLEHEARAFLAVALESKNKMLHAIVSLALYTARRRGDILNLRVRDFDQKNGMLFLANTKSGNPEWIPVPPQAHMILTALAAAATTDWFFPNRIGTGPLKDVDTAFKIAKNRVGLGDFRFHDLRHSGISFMIMAGIDLMTIARLVGHTTPTMIESRYGHLSPKHRQASTVIFGSYMDRLTREPGATVVPLADGKTSVPITTQAKSLIGQDSSVVSATSPL
jgi:integrase